MSDPTDPRSEAPGASGAHPDALTDYVDGTATDEQRRLVDSHLQTCPTCRAEVDLARSSLAATSALDEADAPGLDPAAIAHTARTVVPMTTRRRSTTWLGVAGGLAAASIAVLLAVGLLRTQGGRSAATSAQAPGTESSTFSSPSPGSRVTAGVIVSGEDFTTASVDALATSLASSPAPTPYTKPRQGTNQHPGAELQAARVCAARAAGTSEKPVQMIRATFEGQPAYVTAFRVTVSGQEVSSVVVTSATGCALLYQSTAPVPSG